MTYAAHFKNVYQEAETAGDMEAVVKGVSDKQLDTAVATLDNMQEFFGLTMKQAHVYQMLVAEQASRMVLAAATPPSIPPTKSVCSNTFAGVSNSIEIKFVVGKTYSTRSSCNYDCVYSYEILKRTEKSVWIKSEVGRGVVRRSVKVRAGVEYIYPEGRYSMCPVINAGKGKI